MNLQLEVVEATTREPITTATVRACSRFEQDCATPIGPPVRVDVSGKATIPVAKNFSGYLEVYSGDDPTFDSPDLVRTLVFFPPREIVRGATGRGILGFNRMQITGLAGLSGGSFNNTTGLVVLSALNCKSELAANVSYDVLTGDLTTEATREYYTLDRVPSTSATKTDSSGTGGFTNISPGLVSFSAKVDLNGVERDITQEAGTGVYVRAGWYTQVYVAP